MKMLAMAAAVMAVTGCVSQETKWNLTAQDRVAPTEYTTPLEDAMACSRDMMLGKEDFRLGIGVITAEDGVFDYEGQGNYTPSTSHHMMITALKATGFRVINRLGEVTKVMEWENARAMDKLLGDGKSVYVPDRRAILDDDGDPWLNKEGEQSFETYHREIKYRVLTHGQMLGSTHFLSGAITRLDFNTSSGGFELAVDGIGIGKRVHRMLVGMDLHITNTITGEITWAKGYDKQYFGVEVKAGVFRLLDNNLIDLNMGVETNEPIQTGIHYLIDYAAYDIAREHFDVGETCDQYLPNSILEEGSDQR